ncbi:hypothetical protein TrVFT333_004892 [Trichoderma virens FT-333]|nr:hypothetical protein TrVFT333_004892 [Trichoderma virens FT-333]
MYDEDNAKESFLVLENETVSWDTLESQQLHYKLDTFLRRVQILKNVFIHWDDASSMAHRIARSWDCAGNIDMFMIFYWLMKEARVKKILEVVVCDGAGQEETTGDILAVTKNPHSDQAIIECLWGFGIEILDWERIDIPAETIISAVGDSVKRLHLYCSGRKAVLQSWADTRGLSRLQNVSIFLFYPVDRVTDVQQLEYVSVVIYQGLESITRISNYAAQFHRDLGDTFNSMNPQRKSLIIKYEIVPRAKLSNLEVKSQNEQDFEEQDWLRCMDEFADIMEVVEQQTSLSGPSIQKPTHQIRVALIDDGVKTSYAGLNSNIHTGISVWQPSDSKSTEFANDKPAHYRNYNSSHTGHGTVMAYYIKRLCPKVRLYVAKLDCKSHRGGNGGYSANVTFSLDSVIQAIEWAVEQEVDIISMSWAIEKCRNNNPSYKRLRDAIQAAVEKNIIMFCANPDRGTDFPVNDTYPFSMDKDHIICVGAATRNGVRWAQIDAQDDSCSYFLPGVELGIQVKTELERNPDGPPHEWRKHSGSSLSCALAAGLAAMILHCSLVSGVARFDSPEWKWLRSHEGMHKAFRTIQIDRSTRDNTRFDVILLDDDLFKDDDEKGAELKSSFIIQGSNLGGGEQQGSRVIEENLSKNALTVQCDLAQIIHGTMSEGGTPATLIVFKFKFIPRDNRRRFKNAEITIEFSAGEVFNITPNGTWMTLQSETQQELSHSVDPSLEAGFGPATATLGYTWQLKKNTTVEGHCTVVGYTMALKQTRSMTKARQNTIFWVLRENPQTKSGIPSFMQAAALLKRERTGRNQWARSSVLRSPSEVRKGEDIFFNPKKNRGAVDDANNLRNVKLDTYKKLVAIRPWVDGNGNVEDQVLVPPRSYKMVSDSSEELSRLQAETATFSLSVGDTSKDINRYPAVSDTGEELSGLQTEAAAFTLANPTSTGLTFEDDAGKDRIVSLSVEEKQRILEDLKQDLLLVRNETRLVTQLVILGRDERRLLKESRKLRGFP